MAEACLTCGHEHRHHSGLANMIDCDIPGCSCTKFEPADPKTEQTQGGDAHAQPLDSEHGSATGAHVTGPAGATETPPAGGPDHWKQSEAELPLTTPAGPPDLHQAIHAATVALRDDHPAIGLSDPWTQPARIAIEAAYPLLLHATRDRHADLEMQVAELRDLLEQSISTPDYDSDGQCNYCRMDIQRISRHAHCWQCGLTGGQHLDDCRISAALQTSGPARDHIILQEVQRLREANDGLYRQAMAKELRALQCANCLRYALRWRQRVIGRCTGHQQLTLEEEGWV